MKRPSPPLTGDHGLVTWLNNERDRTTERTLLDGENYKADIGPNGTRLKILFPTISASTEVGQFRVEAVYKNHLLCKPVTLSQAGVRTVENDTEILVPSTDTALVRIAKPDELRVMGWDSNERSIAGLTSTIGGFQYDYLPNGIHPDEVHNPWNKRTRTVADDDILDEHGTDEIVYTDETIYPAYVERHTVIYAAKVKEAPIFSVTEQIIGGVPPDDQATYPIQWVDLNLGSREFKPKERKVRVCNEGQTGTWYVLVRTSDAFQEV